MPAHNTSTGHKRQECPDRSVRHLLRHHARFILESLRFDVERSNERSAMVLLALLQLKPDDTWDAAIAPLLGTRAIMDWIRDHYGVDYKPNSRETIRRFTLHQFVDAGYSCRANYCT